MPLGINRSISVDEMLSATKTSAKQQRALIAYLDEHDFEDFTKLAVGDDWIPKYDYLLFKKAIDVAYKNQ